MKYIAPILLTLVLTACGGGGGGSGTTNSPASSLMQVAVANTNRNTVYTTAVGDINGDGREDVVVSGWGYDSATAYIWVLTQNADGSLTDSTNLLPSNTVAGSQHVFVRDFDGDGHNDIFVPGFRDGSSIQSGVSTIFWGGNSFTRQDFAEAVTAHGACVDDLNSDGRLDMIVAGGGIYYNQGNRTFALDTTALQGNNYFTTCAVMHENSQVKVLLGNNIGNQDILAVYDNTMNYVSNSIVAKGANRDLVQAITYNNQFVLAYNDIGNNLGGPVRQLLNPTTNAVTVIDTLNNNYHAYLTTVNGQPSVFFPGFNGNSRIYNLNTLTAYHSTAFDSMASEVPNRNNWVPEAATVYHNASGTRTFMLQLLNDNFYVKEIQ